MSISSSMPPHLLHCLKTILTLSRPLNSRIRKHQSHAQNRGPPSSKGVKPNCELFLHFLSDLRQLDHNSETTFSFGGLSPFPLSEVALTCCFEFRSINSIFQGLRVTETLNGENGMCRLLFPSITLVLLDTTVRRKHFGESNTDPG